MAAEARRQAKETGELPHEFLLRVCRGELIKGYAWDALKECRVAVYESADMATRIDAAKAAAPYYAPKLSAVEVVGTVIGKATDDELNALIATFAAEAGLSLGIGGACEAAEEDARPAARRRLPSSARTA